MGIGHGNGEIHRRTLIKHMRPTPMSHSDEHKFFGYCRPQGDAEKFKVIISLQPHPYAIKPRTFGPLSCTISEATSPQPKTAQSDHNINLLQSHIHDLHFLATSITGETHSAWIARGSELKRLPASGMRRVPLGCNQRCN